MTSTDIRENTNEPISGSLVDADTRINALHEAHSGPLLRFLIGLTNGERHAAEDLLQETMLRAWRHIESVPTAHENARRWLFTVARRIAIDAFRIRQARPSEVSLLDITMRIGFDDGIETAMAADTVRSAFFRLSVAHQTVLSEMYMHGKAAEEIAEALGVPVGTVKSRAHYGLRSLRAAIMLDE